MATNENVKIAYSNTVMARLVGWVDGVDPRTGVRGRLTVFEIICRDVDPSLTTLEHVIDVRSKLAYMMGQTVKKEDLLPDGPHDFCDLALISDIEMKTLRERGIQFKITNVATVK